MSFDFVTQHFRLAYNLCQLHLMQEFYLPPEQNELVTQIQYTPQKQYQALEISKTFKSETVQQMLNQKRKGEKETKVK